MITWQGLLSHWTNSAIDRGTHKDPQRREVHQRGSSSIMIAVKDMHSKAIERVFRKSVLQKVWSEFLSLFTLRLSDA